MADTPQSLRVHLAELRRRLAISLAALAVGFAAAFIYRNDLYDLLLRPGGYPQLYSFELTGILGASMKVSLLGGVVIALPVFVYQVVMFLSPGLTSREKRTLFTLLPGVVVFFLAGAAFSYFVLVPSVVKFLLTFDTNVAVQAVSIGSYINAVVSLLFWMGVGFEAPFVMYLLTVIGIATPKFFSSQRRLWFVIAFILAAVITPTPDPVNQSLVAGPFIILYEIGIIFSRLAVRKPRKRTALAPEGGR